ncbi:MULTISPECIES: hypothetical protein [Paenibacillus]|uniref:hypothetical protein n=1 Tax=Paenibacillus TaxID=44249 RepID=UPI00038F4104|nr:MULTISPECIES: hypothetical protein [Paenibacillus]KKC49198.1 hypothetical protein VE23_22305 [Paenibacillus sp. D9]CDN42985.1 hypothetical protein BN871_CH_00120 [Paenibacillus sp. P22]
MPREARPARSSNALYAAFFVPLVGAVLMSVIPAWSPRTAWFAITAGVLNMAFVLIMRRTRTLEKSRKRKVIFGISQFNLFVLFMLGIVWRVWDGGLLLAAGLLLLNVVCAFVGLRFRRFIFQEAANPQTKTGRIIYTIGLAGAGAAGILGYSLGNLLGERFAGKLPLFLTLAFVPVSMYVLLVIYSAWSKVDDPDWDPMDAKGSFRSGA